MTAAEKKAMRAEEARRGRVIHGWAFREWTREGKQAIRRYLDCGEMTEHFPDSYRSLHETVQ